MAISHKDIRSCFFKLLWESQVTSAASVSELNTNFRKQFLNFRCRIIVIIEKHNINVSYIDQNKERVGVCHRKLLIIALCFYKRLGVFIDYRIKCTTLISGVHKLILSIM